MSHSIFSGTNGAPLTIEQAELWWKYRTGYERVKQFPAECDAGFWHAPWKALTDAAREQIRAGLSGETPWPLGKILGPGLVSLERVYLQPSGEYSVGQNDKFATLDDLIQSLAPGYKFDPWEPEATRIKEMGL